MPVTNQTIIPPHCREAIRNMMLRESTTVTDVPFEVTDYKEVIQLWELYKGTNELHGIVSEKYSEGGEKRLKELFEMHKTGKDHVFMYISRLMSETLLLCKIGNLYVNIIMPIPDFSQGFDTLHNRNLIATFC